MSVDAQRKAAANPIGAGLMLVLAGGLLLLAGCEPGKAEIRGSTARVVGDRIVLELVEGEDDFGETVRLQTSDGTTYDGERLQLSRAASGRMLTVTIPAGVVTGPARLTIDNPGASDTAFEVPLTIDRFSVFRTEQGEIHLVPLPPAQISPRSFTVGAAPVLCALSDDATTLATASSDGLMLRRLTGHKADQGVNIALTSAVQALAALSDGAVVALGDTSTTPPQSVLRYYRRGTSGDLTELDSRVIPSAQIRDLAAIDRSPQGPIVGVLAECSSGGDCVAQVDFERQPSGAALPLTELDTIDSASTITTSSDGLLVVIPDTDAIYGVAFDAGGAATITRPLDWGQAGATPVSVARTRTFVGQSEDDSAASDVFAAVERSQSTLRLFGAPAGELRELQQQPPPLESPPIAITFGRDRQIYILSDDRKLRTITAGETAGSGGSSSPYRLVDLEVPRGAIDVLVQR
jgi:hypothetical protein